MLQVGTLPYVIYSDLLRLRLRLGLRLGRWRWRGERARACVGHAAPPPPGQIQAPRCESDTGGDSACIRTGVMTSDQVSHNPSLHILMGFVLVAGQLITGVTGFVASFFFMICWLGFSPPAVCSVARLPSGAVAGSGGGRGRGGQAGRAHRHPWDQLRAAGGA